MSGVDYTKVELFDKRPYDDYPYLVLPTDVFRVKLNWDTNFSIRAYVYKRDELFGDPVAMVLAGMTISFSIYNSDNVLINIGEARVSDLDTSEIEYILKDLDIQEEGRYYGHFILTDLEGNSIMLPNPRQKQRIVINVV